MTGSALRGPGPVFILFGAPLEPKPHFSYQKQLAQLVDRGLLVEDNGAALELLKRAGYYCLRGYLYPYRLRNLDGSRSDKFRPETSLSQLRSIWEFDARLRTAAFSQLQHFETYLRALLAYELGAIDPLIHEKPELLNIDASVDYEGWLSKLNSGIKHSKEDFIIHHREARAGVTPIWVATEVLDWGGLSRLFSISPQGVRDDVAREFQIEAPQLKSWIRALNIARNDCAHHGRFFNKYYPVTPKSPDSGRHEELDSLRETRSTTFGQLTVLQFLGKFTLGYNRRILPAVFRTFPHESGLSIGATGAPEDWSQLSLWS